MMATRIFFTTDMLPDNDYRLKTTSSFDKIDVYKLKEQSGFYRQFMQNCLQLNTGNNNFEEIGRYSNTQASDWSWGALMFDANNDGHSDIYVCNGIYHDVTDQDFIDFLPITFYSKWCSQAKKKTLIKIINKMPSQPIVNKMFYNNGNLQFNDSAIAWGFDKPSFSNGAAYGDLDNDGDLDLIINNVNEPAFVYKNNSRQLNKNNFIGFSLKGLPKNYFAIGALIKVYQNEQVFTREVMPSRGFQSSVSYKQLIGLGNGVADSAIIIWQNQTYTKLLKPAVNKVYNIIQQPLLPKYISSTKIQKPIFDSVKKYFR